MSTLRVLNIIDKSMYGGGQHVVFITVSNFNRQVIDSLIACSPGGPLVEKCRDKGIDVRLIAMNKKFKPASVLRLFFLIRREKIRLIHSHGLVATFFSALAAKLAGVPIIYSQHGFHHHGYKGKVSRMLRIFSEKVFIRLVTLTICDSDDNREEGIQKGYFRPQKCITLHPPVDSKYFKTKSVDKEVFLQKLGVQQRTFTFGTVGRFDQAKGYSYLLKALALIKSKESDFQFLFVGDGALEDQLRSEAKALHLSDHVHFLTGQTDVPSFLTIFDLFVSSSLWEGLPLAVCEAMATKLPVVGTSVGGIPEAVVHGKTGIIVPPKNEMALAESIQELLRDQPKRSQMGNAGRERMEEKFRTSVINKRLEEIYQSLIDSK